MRKAKTDAERQAAKRERDKLKEEDRLAQLLAKTIKLQLFHGTSAKLDELMLEVSIDEPQDIITRLIHGTRYLTVEQKKVIFS